MAEEVIDIPSQAESNSPPYFWEVPNNGFILKTGEFSGTKTVRISETGFDSYVARQAGFSKEECAIVEMCNARADAIRPFFQKMINDRDTMQAIMRAKGQENFDLINTLNVPPEEEPRIRKIFNTSLDPELVPLLAIKQAHSEFALTLEGEVLTESLIHDKEIQDLFADLLLDRELYFQANDVSPLKGPTLNKVEKFIDRTVTSFEQQRGKMSSGIERQVREQLMNFFTSVEDTNSPTYMGVRDDAVRITADMYGEHLESIALKGFSLQQDSRDKPDFYINFSIFQNNAFNREKLAYFRSISSQAETGIRDTLPDVYEPNLIEHLCVVPAVDEESSPYYQDKIIYFVRTEAVPDVQDFRDIGLKESDFWPGHTVKQRVMDTIAYIHEWAHARREVIDVKQAKTSIYNDEMATGAIEEGFAVMVEYLAIKNAIKNPAAFGLEESDRKDLIEVRRARTEYLKQYLNHYSEGVLHLLGRIYGEGVKKEHSEAGGLRAMIDFVNKIDMEKASFIMRSMDEYRQIIESHPPVDEIVRIINSAIIHTDAAVNN